MSKKSSLQSGGRALSAGRDNQKGRGCVGVFLMAWGALFGGGGVTAFVSDSSNTPWWFATIFVLIGGAAFVGGLLLFLVKPKDKVALATPLQAGAVASIRRELAPDGQYVLRPAAYRGCKAFFLGIFAAGFTVATIFMFSGRGGNGPPVFMAVIFGFFACVLILGTIHQSLAMTNPVAAVFVRSEELAIGMRHLVTYELTGSTTRLGLLRIELVGREEASYRRGTDTVTDKHEFLVRMLIERDLMAEGLVAQSVRGEIALDLGAGVVPTFKSRSNKVMWFLRVVAPIRWWPDVHDEIELPIGGVAVAPNAANEDVLS